jgi:fucose permease
VGPALGNRLLLVLSCLGFAALGLPDGVLGVAWPSMRASFALPIDALGALLIASVAGYVTASVASGRIVARIGIGALLALSCAATAMAQIGYASARAWTVIVACGVIAGLGAGAIDAGINLYAATRHSPRVLAFLHAGYGLGATAGPAIMTPLLMSGSGWRAGYALLAEIQLALALGFAVVHSRWPRTASASAESRAGPSLAQTLRLRAAQLGSASFFVYVGIEAAIGAWLYTVLVGPRAVAMARAGAAVSTYWGGLLASRVLLALAPIAPAPGVALRGAAGALTVAAVVLALDLGAAADWAAIALVGLAAGPVFPLLIAATPRLVPAAHAPNAVGIAVAAAAAGQASLPAALGLAADAIGITAIPRLIAAATVVLLVIVLALEHTGSRATPEVPELRAG